MLIVYPVGGPPTISKKSPVIKNLSPGMDCIDYEGFMTLFAAALLKHSAGCAQAGQGRNDQQRIGHIVAGLGNVCRNSRRGRCCGRLCRGGRGCGGGSRRRYRRDRSEGVDVGVVSGVGVGVLSCPPSFPLSPPVVPPLPESSVLVGTFVTTAVRVMVKGFSLSFFASAANSSALRVLKSSVPLYSLSLCVQALTL